MANRSLLAVVLATALLSSGAAPAFDPKPWLDDLSQMREAFATKYANLEFEILDREIDLDALFADTRARIEAAGGQADARAAFDRLIRKVDDGHVELHWPKPPSAPADSGPPDLCKSAGYDAAMFAPPVAALAPGYRSISAPAEFPSGTLEAHGHKIGVIKIGLFMSHATPALCADALVALSIDPKKPCNDACRDRIDDWADAKLTADLETALRAIDAAGAEALLVDIARNGGGSEWADAVVREMTPHPIRFARMTFVRGEHWVKEFEQTAADLRAAAKGATPDDRAFLLKLAGEADAKRKVAQAPCDSAPIWKRRKPSCSWLGDGFYESGLIPVDDPAHLDGKPWARLVIDADEYPSHQGVWTKPLIVLIDAYTGSASSRFAATLHDNHAAALIGEPAEFGGGHTDGGTPVTLANTKAVLVLPDCDGVRADGTDESDGVVPDIVVRFAPGDGPHRKAARILEKLPEAFVRAQQLASQAH
ncbi:MAG: S41 family peptidase [Rhizomicrobium sp.]